MFTVRRVLSAAAAAVAAFAVLPAPAQAEPAAPLTLSVHDLGVSQAGKVGDLRLTSGPGAPSALTQVEIVLDLSGIDGFATAYVPSYADGSPKPSPSCHTADKIVTCSAGPLYANTGWLTPRLFVQAEKGAKVGTSGKLGVTVTSKEAAPVKTETTITVAEDVDLAAGPDHPVTTTQPGSAVEQPIEIRNTGTKPVDGAAVEFVYADQGLVPAPQYSNCFYNDGRGELFCKFDEKLAAGTTYRIAAPVFQLKPKAPDGEYFYAHIWSTKDDADEQGAGWYGGDQATPGTGAVLHLEPVPATAALRARTTDSNGANNIAFGYVQTPAAPPSSGSASASASASAAQPGAATAAGDDGPGGGGLPITGPNIALAAGAGVVLLAVGAGLFVVARRRRTSFTA